MLFERLYFNVANKVSICKIYVKYQYANQAVCAYVHIFRKSRGWALIRACALIITNTVIIFLTLPVLPTLFIEVCLTYILAAPVAERLRALFPNHSIISPLCLVWVRAKFCLRVCQVFFHGDLPFSPHLLISPSHIS